MQKLGDTTTLTVKDLYRQAIIRHKERIYAYYGDTWAGDFNQIPIRLLGLHGLVKGLEGYLIPYIREIGEHKVNQEYKARYNEINFDFNTLFSSEANEEEFRKFSHSCLDWVGLLTVYFAEVGIVPKGRIIAYAGDTGINKIWTMHDAVKFINEAVEHIYKIDNAHIDYKDLKEKLNKLEVNYAELPEGHSITTDQPI